MSVESKEIKNPPIQIPPRYELTEIYLKDHNDTTYEHEFIDKNTRPAPDLYDDAIACTRRSCNFHDIKEIFMMLTDDQRKFVMHIYCQYKKNHKQINDNPKIILLGPAGSGKTTVINLIDTLMTWDGNKTSDSPVKTKVLTCAFTISAAAKVNGFTLNSILSKIPLRETRRLDEKMIDRKKDLTENCIFFICDEISMVGENLLKSMNKRLQQLFKNSKMYGNRFVLLVGDLYQFPPVLSRRLYQMELWSCCEFYELTKIIRQKNEKFITLLNNFKNLEMTEEDLTLLRSRIKQNIEDVPDLVIHLFYENDRVYEYNLAKLNKCDGKEVIVRSLNDKNKWKPRNLRVKIGMRYMITKNLDVSDGLENGKIGVVKDFDVVDSEVTVIWMDFHSNKIGQKTRSDFWSNRNKNKKNEWIPIQQSKIVYKSIRNPTAYIEAGKLFPLTEAEAITVHKSQGQTYPDGVCIHITDDKNDMLRTCQSRLYVALTRVQNLDDLYIFGPLELSNMKNNNLISTKDELNRLRTEHKLTLAFETFEDKTDDVIIFLNTGLTFNEDYQFITTDTWYNNGSLLIFTETNTIGSDEVVIPNFEITFHSNTKEIVRSGGGIICYKKASKSIKVVGTMSDNKNKMYLTLLLYEKYLYVLIGNKGDTNDIDFMKDIMQFINEHVNDDMCIFFIGNLDQNLRPNLTQYLNDEKLGIILPYDASDKYDMILTQNFDIKPKQCGFYEYIPSAHKPRYVKLPPKPELPRLDDEPDLRQHCNLNELPVGSVPMKTENEFNRQGTKRKLSQTFETFVEKTEDVIIFLGSIFNEHYQFIADNGSLLIIKNTIGFDKNMVPPNFNIVNPYDTKTALKSGGGIICYRKSSKSVEVIDKGDDNLTLLLYEKYLYIVTGVKVDLKDIHFKNAMYRLIHEHVKNTACIFFIGNLGPNLKPILTQFFHNERIRIKLSYDATDPNQEVPQYDMILTRNFDINLGKFEFDKKIRSTTYVKLPPKPELLKSNNEGDSAHYETPGTSSQSTGLEMIEID